jgi:protein TonB
MVAIRIPFSALGGTLFSAALFLGLWQLVDVQLPAFERIVVVTPEFTRVRPDSPVQPRIREKPVRPPPEPTVIPPKGPGETTTGVTIAPPEPTTIVRPKQQGLELGVDRDTIPLVRINPDYPPRAQLNGTEGWVQVRFTVTAAGTVRDAVVVASEPGSTFDEAALEAIARWRYNPRIEQGQAVERVGLQTMFRFTLQN